MMTYPFQSKSPEELAKEMDKALENADEMTDEEKAEYDAEYGYFEDDEDIEEDEMTNTSDIAALIEENIANGKLYIGDNKVRYALGEPGKRNIICVGVNPSTADFVKDDPTIEQVKRTASQNNYDGWIMLNLYPLRATDFEKLNCFPNTKLLAKNAEIVKGGSELFFRCRCVGSLGR